MALSKMSISELREKLIKLGEEAPKQWSKSQVLLRIVEIEGEEGLHPRSKEKSPLRELEIKINQASRKKRDLVVLATETLEMELTGNEMVEILRMKAMSQAAQVTTPHAQDFVGFGQWSKLTYAQILDQQPGYCNWAKQMVAEGDGCPRLRRLVKWLLDQTIQEEQRRTHKKEVKKGYVTGAPAASSRHMEEMTKMIQQLTAEVTELKSEKESRRKIQSSEADASMSNESEWERPAQA